MTKARVNADNASADIQGVTAGTGLSGGGTSGTVTITNDMATTIAAKGDLVVGTANDTYAALTVGSNNTVLTADSATATGLKWAAIPSSSLSLSQLATGSFSGSSLSISSLSTYDQVDFFAHNINCAGNASLLFRINSNSGSNYQLGPLIQYGSTSDYSYNSTATSFNVTYNATSGSGNVQNMIWARFTNCKGTGFTSFQFVTYNQNASNVGYSTWGYGMYKVAEAVSSISLFPSTSTFSGGTYFVYGG